MLLANVSVSPSVRNTARRAFDGACEELGLGDFSLDVAKRERLAQEMQRLVCKGERDPVVLQRTAVSQFKYSESDVIA
jgi:hypothetical protein